MPPLPADSIHARACKLKCEKILTRPLLENGKYLPVYRSISLSRRWVCVCACLRRAM